MNFKIQFWGLASVLVCFAIIVFTVAACYAGFVLLFTLYEPPRDASTFAGWVTLAVLICAALLARSWRGLEH